MDHAVMSLIILQAYLVFVFNKHNKVEPKHLRCLIC